MTRRSNRSQRDELEEFKRKNFKERLEFLDKYVAWLKKTPNKEWSKQQNELLKQ